MSKRVLILCQRKQGMDKLNRNNVKDSVIPKINEYVEKFLGDNTIIEYLTDDKSDPTVDYQITLESNNSEADEFISNHRGMYSLIILNTCPFSFMDFGIIHSLLEPEGFMVFKIFPNDDTGKDYLFTINDEKREILHHYFRIMPFPEFDKDNYNVYQKIEIRGGKKKNKKSIKKHKYKKRNFKKTIKKYRFKNHKKQKI